MIGAGEEGIYSFGTAGYYRIVHFASNGRIMLKGLSKVGRFARKRIENGRETWTRSYREGRRKLGMQQRGLGGVHPRSWYRVESGGMR